MCVIQHAQSVWPGKTGCRHYPYTLRLGANSADKLIHSEYKRYVTGVRNKLMVVCPSLQQATEFDQANFNTFCFNDISNIVDNLSYRNNIY